jgi:glycerol-3-phosphate acyltransferase PlsY
MFSEIGFTLIAYLLGSIPFGYLLVKYVFTAGEDVRRIGSGATGATNVARRAGLWAGALTYVLDFTKGSVAVVLMERIAGDDYFWLGAAFVAVTLGHILPVFLKFRGGKGVATAAGAYFVLAPYSVLCALVVWAVALRLTKYMSIGSMAAATAIPLCTLLIYGVLTPAPHVNALLVIAVLGCVIVVSAHHENIRRLINGTENKVGRRATGT